MGNHHPGAGRTRSARHATRHNPSEGNALETAGGERRQRRDALFAQKKELEAAIAKAAYRWSKPPVRAPFVVWWVSRPENSARQYEASEGPLFTLIATANGYVVATLRRTECRASPRAQQVRVYLMIDPRRSRGVVDSVGWGVLPTKGQAGTPSTPRFQSRINWVQVERLPPFDPRFGPPRRTVPDRGSAVAPWWRIGARSKNVTRLQVPDTRGRSSFERFWTGSCRAAPFPAGRATMR